MLSLSACFNQPSLSLSFDFTLSPAFLQRSYFSPCLRSLDAFSTICEHQLCQVQNGFKSLSECVSDNCRVLGALLFWSATTTSGRSPVCIECVTQS